MSIFQFLLFIISIIVFVLFFKQLFSGSFPKRGIDLEANSESGHGSKIRQIDQHFSSIPLQLSRIDQLIDIADIAIEKNDFIEADKALSSALILEKDRGDLLLKHGFVLMNLDRLSEAKESYIEAIRVNPNDDMAHVLLANILHRLEEDESAIEHHKKAIAIDPLYAPHYFNYANTLYDLAKKDEALLNYKKSYELDSSLVEAEKMIKELS